MYILDLSFKTSYIYKIVLSTPEQLLRMRKGICKRFCALTMFCSAM
jgi:hypothetical protein